MVTITTAIFVTIIVGSMQKFAEMSIEWADAILSDDLRDLHVFP